MKLSETPRKVSRHKLTEAEVKRLEMLAPRFVQARFPDWDLIQKLLQERRCIRAAAQALLHRINGHTDLYAPAAELEQLVTEAPPFLHLIPEGRPRAGAALREWLSSPARGGGELPLRPRLT